MNRALTLAALLLAAACSGQDPAPGVVNEVSKEAEAPAAEQPVPALDGQWRVTALDGNPLARPMTASFADGAVSLSAGCIRRAWDYTQKRNAVSFNSSPGGSANCGGQAPGAGDEAVYAVLDGANIAVFDKDGTEATLSGTGGTLTLAR